MTKTVYAALLLVAQALAHSGVSKIEIDGIIYPPWDVRIDSYLGPVKRIGWSYQAPPSQLLLNTNPQSHQFGPITKMSDPAIACGANAEIPALKAVARAGADVNVTWSNIIRMHRGPILSYMGQLPTPNTSVNAVKFFKVEDKGYDPKTDTWANERAANAGMSHSFQIPSDIKPGTYVLRTELLALHANTAAMKMTPVSGPEFYLQCFNIEVTGDGTATPEGNTFPGTYMPTDPGLSFVPYYGDGSGVEHNSKYVSPGPKMYQGKYDAPTSQPPAVKETGAYSGDLKVKYEALRDKISESNTKIIEMVNKAWPANKEFNMQIGLAYMKTQMSSEWKDAWAQYNKVQTDVQALKSEIQKQQ